MDTKGKMILGACVGGALGCIVWLTKIITPALVFGGQFGMALSETLLGPGAQDTVTAGVIVGISVLIGWIGSFALCISLGAGAGAGVARLIAAGTHKPSEKV